MKKIKIFIHSHFNFDFMKNNDIYEIINANEYKCKDSFFTNQSTYCELTTIYYAWKKIDLDYYGFCHYRRFLILNKSKNIIDMCPYMTEEALKNINNLGNDIHTLLDENSIIVPKPLKLKETLYEQYINSECHYKEDFDFAIQLLLKKEEKNKNKILKILSSNKLYIGNIFITSKKIFFEYCEWLFPILEEIYKKTDYSSRSKYSKRNIGFISERLFTIYLGINSKTIKIKELTLLQIENNKLEYDKNKKNIFICAEKNNINFLKMSLLYLINSYSKNINLFILEKKIMEDQKNNLIKFLDAQKISNVNFFNLDYFIKNYYNKKNNEFNQICFHFILKNFSSFNISLFINSNCFLLKNISGFEKDLDEYKINAMLDWKKTINEIKKQKNNKPISEYFYINFNLMILNISLIKNKINDDNIENFYKKMNLSLKKNIKLMNIFYMDSWIENQKIKKINYVPSQITDSSNPLFLYMCNIKDLEKFPTSFSKNFWKIAKKNNLYESLIMEYINDTNIIEKNINLELLFSYIKKNIRYLLFRFQNKKFKIKKILIKNQS